MVVKATEITGKDVKLQPYATSVMIVNAMKEVEKLVNSHCKLRAAKTQKKLDTEKLRETNQKLLVGLLNYTVFRALCLVSKKL